MNKQQQLGMGIGTFKMEIPVPLLSFSGEEFLLFSHLVRGTGYT